MEHQEHDEDEDDGSPELEVDDARRSGPLPTCSIFGPAGSGPTGPATVDDEEDDEGCEGGEGDPQPDAGDP